MKLGDQPEWRNGRFKILFEGGTRSVHLVRNKFRMLGILESERDDDDDVQAPIYLFHDGDNGRWIMG